MDVITYALSKKYIQKCLDGLGVLKGANCIIESVTPVSEGNQITFSWTGTSGAKETTTILVKNGEQGNGIVKVEKIKTIGLVDTYRMTFDDGSTFEYEVTNGSNSGGGTSTWSEVNNKPFETIGSDFTVVNNELKLADGIDGKIDTIKVNGVELPIVDKAVDIAVPSIDGLTKDSDLSIVAKSGSYNDLTDTPAIPSIEGLAKTEDIPTKVSDLENDSNYLSSVPEEYITDTELEAKGYLTEHQDISGKVDKVEGKSLIADTEIARLASVDNYDDTDIRAEITKKADAASIPSKVSDLENDSKYQTESDITTTLTNYATQTYVGEQIANAEHLKREIVTVIPSDEEASDNVIYMLKVESTTGNDKYQEYMKIDGTVQMVGDTSVDLTDYAKIDNIPTTVAELTDSADYAKKTDVNDSISTLQTNKADASDLTAHTDNTNIHVTAVDKNNWDNKFDSNQGTSNAGKLLGTNSNGDVVAIQGYGFEYNEETKMLEYGTDPTTNLNQGIGLDDTLSKKGYAAEASAVGELKSDIADLEKNVGYENITIEEQSTGYINPQLDVVATTEWGYSKPIFVEGGKKYYYYSNNYEAVSAITWGTSDGQRKQVLHLGVNGINTIEFTPSENMYIILCYSKSVTPKLIEGNDVNNVLNKVVYEDVSRNKLDTTKVQFGYLDNGNIIDTNPTTNWFTTDFIEVGVGENYIFSSNVDNTRTPMHLYFFTKYNKNKEFISSVTDQGTEYTVEPNVHYIRFCYDREQNEPMLEIGYTMSETFIPFSNTPTFTNHKPLVDYTWLLVGDSLTEKNYRATQSYYDFIAENTGISLINKGHSGLGYLKDHYFYNAISEVDDNKFNFCTFFGSGNDLSYETVWTDGRTWEQALGNATDIHWQSICGCINMTINRFYELHPLKKLGIVTPIPWTEYANEDGTINGTRMDDYSNALIEICKMRGIPCLDLYHESGLRPWDNTFRTTYYNELGVQDGGVHPNSKGHKWIYPMFLKFIEQYLM